MASGHVSRIKRPNTWLHRPMLQNVKKALANPEPSTHDPQLTFSAISCAYPGPYFGPSNTIPSCLIAVLLAIENVTSRARQQFHFRHDS